MTIPARPSKAIVLFGVICLAALTASRVHADQVTAKGTVLQGKVTGVSATGVTLETDYGKGAIEIPWKNVEDVTTEGSVQVLYGEGETITAPLRGYRDGKLLVGSDVATATAIDPSALTVGTAIGAAGPGWQDRMRDYWRYWDGSFDVGFNLQDATTDTTGFSIGFATVRTKAPTRFTLAGNYRYGTQKPKDETQTITEDRAFGLVRGDYDLTKRLYAFASGDATYDAIQHLSIRGVPKLGLGYTVWEEKLDEKRRNFVSVEAGGAYVYEAFFGPEHDDFFAVAFGAAAGYYLPYGAIFSARVDYLPSVSDFTGDYLLRGEAGLTLPVVDPIALKLGILDEYDSTPAEGTDGNALYFTSALSLLW